MANNLIDGVGKLRVVITSDRGTEFDYTFPICAQQHGYSREIPEEYLLHKLITLDVNNQVYSEEKYRIGFWNVFTFDWTNFPIPLAMQIKVIEMKNKIANDRVMKIFPKATANTNYYIVNDVSGSLLIANSDSPFDIGNFGTKLVFRSIQTEANIGYFEPGVAETLMKICTGGKQIFLVT